MLTKSAESELPEILNRLREGDYKAFEWVYDRFSGPLSVRLEYILKSEVLVQEALQDVFLALWEHRTRIDTSGNIQAYLSKIATNVALNVFKKAAHDRQYRSYLYTQIDEAYDHIEAQIFKKENQALIDQLLSGMPEMQRNVFVQCKIEGLSYEQVATTFHISTGTVHTHMKRSKVYLREYLRAHPDLFLMVLGFPSIL